MTTEDDFQAALDAHPDDWQTRLVFADWLQERDDPRAEGYRALAVGRHQTDGYGPMRRFWWSRRERDYPSALPNDWYALVPEVASRAGGYDRNVLGRRAAEDAAALAFARLPDARRAELLAVPLAPAPIARRTRRGKS